MGELNDGPIADDRDCFVIMPFGEKTREGRTINFNRVYADLIKPAIETAGLKPVRADEITRDNLIGRRMFDRLAHASYVLADGTFLNANVFYELGVRHTLRRNGTIAIAEEGTDVPFDTKDLSFLRYRVGEDGAVIDLENRRKAIRVALEAARVNSETDSPIGLHLHDLDVRYKSPVLPSGPPIEYALREDSRWRIGYIPGNLDQVRNVDAWVNSENRYMLMARFFERSVSGLIRSMGAEKKAGVIVRDQINDNLRRRMQGRDIVELGTVLDTAPGALRKSHNVKRIFHVASVDANQNSGYRVENVSVCSQAVLDAAHRFNRGKFGKARVQSLIMPMFGTGAAQVSPETIADQLLEGVLRHCRGAGSNPGVLTRCYFLVFTERDRDALERALRKRADLFAPA